MKDSQINPQEHSEIKVLVLQKYLEKYVSILSHSQFVSEVDVYDLFCGEGVYENGKEGSPIIILKLINEIYNRFSSTFKGGIHFNCHFNDFNSSKIEKLQNSIAKYKIDISDIVTINLLNKNYIDFKQNIFSQKTPSSKRRFIFIDPYGYKDISIVDIEQMLSDGYTEVLLFLPTQFMYRFEKDATPDSLQNFLNDTMLGLENERSRSGIDFIDKLKRGFNRRLIGKHVDSFIITRDNNQYFAMFFFTSHLFGFEKFLEAKWEIDEDQGRGWSPKPFGQGDLFTQVDRLPHLDKFEENLIEFLKSKRTNIEIHRFTLLNGHLVKHTNQILKNLQIQDRIIVTLNDGTKARKNSFYLGWDEVKTKEPKTYFQIV